MSDEEEPNSPLARSFTTSSPFHSSQPPPERGQLLILVSRAEWSAEPSTGEADPLEHPVANVVLHWTDTEGCNTKHECSRMVWMLQKKHMREQGCKDIQYNFLVGSDGHAYEGLGWTKASPMVDDVEGLEGSSVVVALLGTKSAHSSALMKTSLSSLMTTGILEDFLEDDHRIMSLINGTIVQPASDGVSEENM